MKQRIESVVIVGGGAAGLAAAITAARAGVKVTVLEADDRVGRKILATGNGRCNLLNMMLRPDAFNMPDFVSGVLDQQPALALHRFFDGLGLLMREEEDGRVYPLSNTATSVLDVLRLACEEHGVDIRCGFSADHIHCDGPGFDVDTADNERVHADACIVACGGGSRLLESCGHKMTAIRPVLSALETNTDPIRGLSGVRSKVRMLAFDATGERPFAAEFGEVLFRDHGLSGIVTFDMSRHVNKGDWISLDLLPELQQEAVAHELELRLGFLAEQGIAPSYERLLTGMLHPRINAAVLRVARVRASSTAERDKLTDIAHAIKDFRLGVKGPLDVKHAQVSRGGALPEEFDPESLCSKLHPGLYAVGEVLDVDGRCGGYNLGWAWASGIVAANHLI